MKTSVYEIITNKMIEKITATGRLPWHKPFIAGDGPHNVNGRAYRGCNYWMLDLERDAKNYTTNTWLTFNEATKRGADLTGERSCSVIFMKKFEDKETGEERFTMRYFQVWNADQCKGITLPKPAPRPEVNPIEEAEIILQNMPNRPTIETNKGGRACYFPNLDKVSMPPMKDFKAAESYYSVIFHELGHSTAHPSRLNREVGAHIFGSKDYSREELVAEMTAAFLMGITGINNEQTENNSAAYLQGWLSALRNDPKMLIQAASQAQRAADYIAGSQPATEASDSE